MTDIDNIEKNYRPSATVIIAAKTAIKEQGYDYRILLAKRTEATAYTKDHYVFPGGVFDRKADENIEWLTYFESFGISAHKLNELCLQHLPNRPIPLMTNGINFSRDISLRITAIREAFEEVGVLLCLDREQLKLNHQGLGSLKLNFDRSFWQQKVHNNAMEFLNLCKYLRVVPDLWSLHEWSVWRSPPSAMKRYDTALYLVALEEQPQLVLEPSEVETELWISPSLSLKLFKDRTIWLPPLQFYEISRLTNAPNWFKLLQFVRDRNAKGSTLLMLAYYRCRECLVGTLPGDDFYPENPIAHIETIEVPCTDLEFRAKATNLHRLTYRDMYDMYVTSNITAIDGHLSPVARLMADHETSKL